MKAVLQVQNLSVDFETQRGRLQALRDVSFSIDAGEIVGVVGESGCGKSTLIASLMRLLADNAILRSGSALLQDKDLLQISQRDMQALRGRDISVVFQDPMTALNPVISIGQQMIDIQHREQISKAEKRKRVINILEKVGIPDPASRLNAYPHEFSGGMRQRVCIAMALMMRPKLLIADEPTTALDATLEVQVLRLLQELQSEIGCSILFISHHLGVIAELCSKVIVMYAGEVVEYGPVSQIFRSPSHPYTRKLLECDPGRIKERSHVLPSIPGELPDLTQPPPGCIFRLRCDLATEKCLKQIPEAQAVSTDHWAKCHYAESAQ
ncbi:ABC transporter ATP-binding protein [Nitrincola alkalilacustris]|uniref:ABC transporter ATP-binding protein n=1 Tax=Nitrincola alkalilacustris TaxID=1571224 RepID=UPI00124F3AED|nr:ABC transporter ATP-binding protein [Nitrincola alkalilacustris]